MHGDRGGRAGVDRTGGPELGDRADQVETRRAPRTAPDPPDRSSRTHARGSRVSSRGTEPGRLSMPTTGRFSAPAHARNPATSSWCRTCWYRSVTIAPRRFQRRRPTTCTSRARNAFAVRTTEPMLKSCWKFSTATCKSCRRVSRSATTASTTPVAVAIDHVAPVAVLEQLGVVARVVRPGTRPRPDAHLVTVGRHPRSLEFARCRLTSPRTSGR